jgi:hypothetical protein
MKHPLSDFVASPSHPAVEGDGSLGAGRPFLAASMLEHASFMSHQVTHTSWAPEIRKHSHG